MLGMKNVNIFLASSITEMQEDRLAFGDFVRRLNDEYVRHGFYLRLFLCEDEEIAMVSTSKQEAYNQYIRDSQLFYALFHTNVGTYTLEELGVARQQTQAQGSPRVMICFREGEGAAPEREAADLMRRLDAEGQDYLKYDHIETLQQDLLEQLRLINLPAPAETADGFSEETAAESAERLSYVNLFVAASSEEQELRKDCLGLGDYIRKLNDLYVQHRVYFRLAFCRDEEEALAVANRQSAASRIEASQLYMIVIFNRTAQGILSTFDLALRHFRKNGTPAILTCFRQEQGHTPQQSVKDFMRKLDQELGHYFKIYEHIDTLKLALLMQIKLMSLDVPVEFTGGKALVDGQEALTLENLPMLLKNVDYQALKKQYDEAQEAFLEAKARYLVNPEDDDSFLAASGRFNKAKKALHELEDSLIATMLGMEELNANGALTARERQAYALLEQGQPDAASAILDEQEIEADADRAETLQERGKALQEQCVQELLMKIKIEKSRVNDPGRFERIIALYEKAVAREERQRLDKKAMRSYCEHLGQQHDYQRLSPLAERYRQYMALEGSEKGLTDG